MGVDVRCHLDHTRDTRTAESIVSRRACTDISRRHRRSNQALRKIRPHPMRVDTIQSDDGLKGQKAEDSESLLPPSPLSHLLSLHFPGHPSSFPLHIGAPRCRPWIFCFHLRVQRSLLALGCWAWTEPQNHLLPLQPAVVGLLRLGTV